MVKIDGWFYAISSQWKKMFKQYFLRNFSIFRGRQTSKVGADGVRPICITQDSHGRHTPCAPTWKNFMVSPIFRDDTFLRHYFLL